jgi:hypothetical protein
MDALRAWLANGIHIFGVDPRRRLGHHGNARQALAEDLPPGHASSGALQALASALHRHTVRGGMSELSAEERQVITLAYLEGHSNREIAAMLGVSVSTVRRRLWLALKRLDLYISRTGTWLSAILLLGIGYMVDRAAKLGRWANADWSHKVASTVAVGAITVTAFGLTAISPDSTRPHAAGPRTAQGLALRPGVGERVLPGHRSNVHPVQVARIIKPHKSQKVSQTVKLTKTADVDESESEDDSRDADRGCHGNPTSAPPPVPVGPRTGHPAGAPVSHPTAGGCQD